MMMWAFHNPLPWSGAGRQRWIGPFLLSRYEWAGRNVWLPAQSSHADAFQLLDRKTAPRPLATLALFLDVAAKQR
jgi:hypothetical protein